MLKKILLLLTLTTMATQAADRIFELRTYTAKEGRLDDVLARFRDHTARLFEKHGMQNIGYWVPVEEPASGNTLIYVVAHKSRDAAAKSWDAFRKDSEWLKAKQESEKNGQIVDKVVSVFMSPAGFSKIK